MKDNHEAIISEKDFNRVQKEKSKRTNVVVEEGGIKRKSNKYNSKN
ncbi:MULTISPECIES: hypothetical protein [Peptoniphilaceae]